MRIVLRLLAGIVGLALIAALVVFAGSEWVLRATHAVEARPVAADHRPQAIAEGARLAKVMGCTSCHGPAGQGRVIVDSAALGRIATPAFARTVTDYSDAELARAIRQGVRRDGTGVPIMPTEAFRNLADEDVARLMGWIRSLRPGAGDQLDHPGYGPVGRLVVLTGAFPLAVQSTVAGPAKRPADPGRYLVETACLSCHAVHEPREAHDDGRPVPALAEMVPAYDPGAFRTLLATGKGMSGRDLGMMKMAARDGLHALTDDEIEAIRRYLVGEAR
ncbi:c-type cytochrome [Sphingomonas sp.]|uniref:c-type cytochrome n=1 Tax=Sphingomonas sp. TaxID=28214 RepID=UPI001EBA11B5|nr:c-type cytochrome [Sphingomonas sp.]MBX3595539.1 c-type cytochrome [Sphingomonas sp.]